MYLLFAGYNYYPSGGWGDFKKSCETLEEMAEFIKTMPSNDVEWFQVVHNNEIIYTSPWW